jgi:lyso-ornithine lipid O-acyltransferase
VNFVSTPFPESSTLEPESRSPVSLLSRLGRTVSVLATTAWATMRVGACEDPNPLMHRWAISVLASLRVRVEVQGELDPWPQLWIANHLSWLDPLVLMSLRPMGAMAKHEVSRYPLISHGARKTGLIFVDRADPASRASALVSLVAELRRRKPMLLFPEGTTTCGHRLAPLQEGGLRAAFRCATPIQAVRLFSKDPAYPWIGDDELLPHILNIMKTGQTRVSVQARAVLEPWQFPDEASWIAAIQRELAP